MLSFKKPNTNSLSSLKILYVYCNPEVKKSGSFSQPLFLAANTLPQWVTKLVKGLEGMSYEE